MDDIMITVMMLAIIVSIIVSVILAIIFTMAGKTKRKIWHVLLLSTLVVGAITGYYYLSETGTTQAYDGGEIHLEPFEYTSDFQDYRESGGSVSYKVRDYSSLIFVPLTIMIFLTMVTFLWETTVDIFKELNGIIDEHMGVD